MYLLVDFEKVLNLAIQSHKSSHHLLYLSAFGKNFLCCSYTPTDATAVAAGYIAILYIFFYVMIYCPCPYCVIL
jgi:hypothetical protein